MATSKLLKPTNVTISIPEFTDQPDQRVNSNCIDKEADAINALSEHIATKEPLILHETKTMTSSSDSIRLDTVGIDGSKVLNAVVTNTNNIGCLLYKYSTYWYLAFINVSTMERASGQYDVLISYRAS